MVRKIFEILILVVLIVILNFPYKVEAASTYYVAINGNDNNSGAIASPWATLGYALTRVSPSDTILMRGGIYDQYLYVDPFYGTTRWIASGTSWNNKIRIANYPGETVWLKPSSGPLGVLTIRGDFGYLEFDGINVNASSPNIQNDIPVLFSYEDGGAFRMAHHIRFMNAEVIGRVMANDAVWLISLGGHVVDNAQGGFEILNNKVHSGTSYGIYVATPNSLIDGNDFYDVAAAGIHVYNGGGDMPSNNIIRNNRIHDITGFQTYFSPNDNRMWGILLAGDNNQVYNNVFYNMCPSAGACSGGMLSVYYGSGNKFWNNTVYNNNLPAVDLDTGASNTEIKNNILYDNYGTFIDNGSGTITSNNLCNSQGTGCQFSGNPNFVNTTAKDLHLQSNSPAVNAGVNTSMFTTDITGAGRIGNYDIGAYEYNGGTSPPPPTPTPTPPSPTPTPTPPPPSSSQTPVAWYKFDGNLNDSSGNNLNGTVSGATSYVTGKIGQAFSFNGSNYISLNNPSQLNFDTNSFSYSLWIYKTRSVNYEIPWHKGGSSSANIGYDLECNSSGSCTAYLSDGTNILNGSFGTIPLNQWTLLTAVVDKSANRLYTYVNSNLIGNTNIIGLGSVSSASEVATIGVSNSSYNLSGQLDDVRIYNRALSASDVQTLATSLPLVGDLNQDHIVNSLDWSIINSKWFTNDSNADLNHDGIVNAIDFSLLNSNWFKTW